MKQPFDDLIHLRALLYEASDFHNAMPTVDYVIISNTIALCASVQSINTEYIITWNIFSFHSFRIWCVGPPADHHSYCAGVIFVVVMCPLFSVFHSVATAATCFDIIHTTVYSFRSANPQLIGSIWIDTNFGTCIMQRIFVWHVLIGSIYDHYDFLLPPAITFSSGLPKS